MNPHSLRRRLKLRDLELLAVLGDVRNINGAARILHTSQPAVSRSLAQIEQALDARLFERTARGTVPTPVGERIIHYARQCMETLDRAADDLTVFKQGGLGSVSVGCNYSAAAYLLPLALQRLALTAPGVSVTAREGALDALLADLLSGRVEIVIARLGPAVYDDAFATQLLFEEPMCLICGPEHPLARQVEVGWDDLLRYAWILPPRGTPVRERLGELLRQHGLRWPASQLESASILLNTALLRSTEVISITPAAVADQQTRMGLVHRITFDLPEVFSPVGLVFARDLPLSPLVSSLVSCIEAEVRAMAG